MRIYRKKMRDLVVGDVVAGILSGWWRITRIEISRYGDVVAYGTNTATGASGWVQGHVDDYRDLVDA